MATVNKNWSRGEVRSLVTLACRGVGMEWGVCEEASFSVLWLQNRNLPGVSCLGRHLSAYDSSYCPIRSGILVSDGIELREAHLNYPLLIIPFLVRSYHCVDVQFDNIESRFGSSGLISSSDDSILHIESSDCRWRTSQKTESSFVLSDRVHCSPSDISVLEEFASRTYAPVTSHSRETGAGSGDDDND